MSSVRETKRKPMRKVLLTPGIDPRFRAKMRAIVDAVHVLPGDPGWRIMKVSMKRGRTQFDTQEEAVAHATKLSARHGVALIFHDGHGNVQELRAASVTRRKSAK